VGQDDQQQFERLQPPAPAHLGARQALQSSLRGRHAKGDRKSGRCKPEKRRNQVFRGRLKDE